MKKKSAVTPHRVFAYFRVGTKEQIDVDYSEKKKSAETEKKADERKIERRGA